jgi:hypothetical protein
VQSRSWVSGFMVVEFDLVLIGALLQLWLFSAFCDLVWIYCDLLYVFCSLFLLLHDSLLFLAEIEYGEYVCTFEAKKVWGFCSFFKYLLNPLFVF